MKILLVCMGNICRSPIAEGVFRSVFPDTFTFDSAGTIDYHEGDPPDPRSVEVMAKHGIDISGQKSRPLIQDDFTNFDRIYCMDDVNIRDIKKICNRPEFLHNVEKITTAAGFPNDIVPDPYYENKQAFEDVYHQIMDLASIIKERLV